MTQEHGRVESISGQLDYSKYPLGSMLTLIPYHVSAAQGGVRRGSFSVSSTLLLSDSLLLFTVMCHCSDASRLPCALRGTSPGNVDTNPWLVIKLRLCPAVLPMVDFCCNNHEKK